MKLGAINNLKTSFKYLFLFFFVFSSVAIAQETDEQEVDSVKTGFDLGRIVLENPESIVSKYLYDEKLDRYIYNEQIGDFNIG